MDEYKDERTKTVSTKYSHLKMTLLRRRPNLKLKFQEKSKPKPRWLLNILKRSKDEKKGQEQIRGSDDPKALQGLYHKLKAKMNEYKSIIEKNREWKEKPTTKITCT